MVTARRNGVRPQSADHRKATPKQVAASPREKIRTWLPDAAKSPASKAHRASPRPKHAAQGKLPQLQTDVYSDAGSEKASPRYAAAGAVYQPAGIFRHTALDASELDTDIPEAEPWIPWRLMSREKLWEDRSQYFMLTPEEKLERMFSIFDTNEDGRLTYNEISVLLSAIAYKDWCDRERYDQWCAFLEVDPEVGLDVQALERLLALKRHLVQIAFTSLGIEALGLTEGATARHAREALLRRALEGGLPPIDVIGPPWLSDFLRIAAIELHSAAGTTTKEKARTAMSPELVVQVLDEKRQMPKQALNRLVTVMSQLVDATEEAISRWHSCFQAYLQCGMMDCTAKEWAKFDATWGAKIAVVGAHCRAAVTQRDSALKPDAGVKDVWRYVVVVAELTRALELATAHGLVKPAGPLLNLEVIAAILCGEIRPVTPPAPKPPPRPATTRPAARTAGQPPPRPQTSQAKVRRRAAAPSKKQPDPEAGSDAAPSVVESLPIPAPPDAEGSSIMSFRCESTAGASSTTKAESSALSDQQGGNALSVVPETPHSSMYELDLGQLFGGANACLQPAEEKGTSKPESPDSAADLSEPAPETTPEAEPEPSSAAETEQPSAQVEAEPAPEVCPASDLEPAPQETTAAAEPAGASQDQAPEAVASTHSEADSEQQAFVPEVISAQSSIYELDVEGLTSGALFVRRLSLDRRPLSQASVETGTDCTVESTALSPFQFLRVESDAGESASVYAERDSSRLSPTAPRQ